MVESKQNIPRSYASSAGLAQSIWNDRSHRIAAIWRSPSPSAVEAVITDTSHVNDASSELDGLPIAVVASFMPPVVGPVGCVWEVT
jgi:hypothetical protein